MIMILIFSSCLILISIPVSAVEEYKFSSNIRINDDTLTVMQTSPGIAVANNGYVYIVWGDGRNDPINLDIYCSKSTDGGNIFGDGIENTDIRVDSNSGSSSQRNPTITTYNNEVYVVWMDDRTSVYHIYFAKSTDHGATFGTNVRVDSSPSDAICEYPDIKVTSTGTICVVWHEYLSSKGNYDVYYSESIDGGDSFSARVRVDDTDTGSS